MSRSEEYPTLLLTGLLNITYFGYPDFDKILDDYYNIRECANSYAKIQRVYALRILTRRIIEMAVAIIGSAYSTMA